MPCSSARTTESADGAPMHVAAVSDLTIRNALRPVKRLVGRVLRASPISSLHFGPPKRVATSTEHWVREASPKWRASYSMIVPAQTRRRIPPVTNDTEVHWKFEDWYDKEEPSGFVATMRDGRVWGRNGAVLTPDDCLLLDVSRETATLERSHAACHRLRLGNPVKYDQRVAVIATAWSNVYFHWMLDVLPRIDLLRRAGMLSSIDAFVLPEITQSFQRESLDRLGIEEARRIEAVDPWRFHLLASELIVPSLPSRLDAPQRWACEFLRNQFGRVVQAGKRSGRRLYLSRSNARGRRVLNEKGVLGSLLPLGFELILLDEMSLEEQATLLMEAACVVGPHGAGLTNIVFCRAGTVVVDVFAPSYFNPCYWVIANEIGLVYAYTVGEGERPPRGTDPERRADDLTIDISGLLSVLKRVGIS